MKNKSIFAKIAIMALFTITATTIVQKSYSWRRYRGYRRYGGRGWGYGGSGWGWGLGGFGLGLGVGLASRKRPVIIREEPVYVENEQLYETMKRDREGKTYWQVFNHTESPLTLRPIGTEYSTIIPAGRSKRVFRAYSFKFRFKGRTYKTKKHNIKISRDATGNLKLKFYSS